MYCAAGISGCSLYSHWKIRTVNALTIFFWKADEYLNTWNYLFRPALKVSMYVWVYMYDQLSTPRQTAEDATRHQAGSSRLFSGLTLVEWMLTARRLSADGHQTAAWFRQTSSPWRCSSLTGNGYTGKHSLSTPLHTQRKQIHTRTHTNPCTRTRCARYTTCWHTFLAQQLMKNWHFW